METILEPMTISVEHYRVGFSDRSLLETWTGTLGARFRPCPNPFENEL